jgi:GxxExxY protein
MDTKATKVVQGRTTKKPNETSRIVIGGAMRVHSALGAGVLESACSACLAYEFTKLNLHFEQEVRLPVVYEGVRLQTAYRVDFIVEKCLVVELKCVARVLPVHRAQLLSYLRLSGHKPGLLLNFNVPHMRQGIHRVINGPESEL